MTISCIIVDDEEIAIQHLMTYIAQIPYLQLEQYFTDPVEAVHYLENKSIDLVFLDIEMPNYDIDGIDFIKIMGDGQYYIFTTAYPQYALSSYEYNAVDFLHKPFPFKRFLKAVQKVKQLMGNSTEEVNPNGVEDYMYVKFDGRLQRIYFDNICWIESDRNYISIFTETDRINILLSISDIEQQLPRRLFARVHKSYIIAYRKVEVIEKDQLQVQRQDSAKWIPLGEQFKKTFLHNVDQKTLKKQ